MSAVSVLHDGLFPSLSESDDDIFKKKWECDVDENDTNLFFPIVPFDVLSYINYYDGDQSYSQHDRDGESIENKLKNRVMLSRIHNTIIIRTLFRRDQLLTITE